MIFTKVSEIFRVCRELDILEVEVPRLFSCTRVFPGLRDGHLCRQDSKRSLCRASE